MTRYLTKLNFASDHTPDWEMLRDFDAGERVVKSRGERYLPKAGDADATEYAAFLKRAQFTNFLRQTVNSLRNLVFGRQVNVVLPPGSEDLAPLLDVFTRDGETFDLFCRRVVREVILMGRFGALVDADEHGHVYAAGYSTEAILGAQLTYVDGRLQPSAIMLAEPTDIVLSDGNSADVRKYRFRELGLTVDGYVQRVVDSAESPPPGMAGSSLINPTTARRQNLRSIPFTFFSPENLSARIEQSPMLDLAFEQGHHYRFSADLNWGRHFTGLPTPVIIGAGSAEPNQKYAIGPSRAWVLDAEGDAKMLEFTGSGLKYLENAISKTEQNMVALGARMLTGVPSGGSENPLVAGMRQRNERGLLYQIIDVAEMGLTDVLKNWVRFQGRDPQGTEVHLNRDFRDTPLTQRESQMLMRAYLAGLIPQSVLDQSMIEGDVLATGVTPKDLAERRKNPDDMIPPERQLDKV